MIHYHFSLKCSNSCISPRPFAMITTLHNGRFFYGSCLGLLYNHFRKANLEDNWDTMITIAEEIE